MLNVGIVGTGIFARERHLPSYRELSDKFAVIACFNRTKSKAEEFAQVAGIDSRRVYEDLNHLLSDEDIDFIDAMLPVQFNYTTAKQAVESGKPILLEKPISANLSQARELVKLAENTDIPVGIAENWLFLNCIDVVKENLAKIGPVEAFTYNATGPFFPNSKYIFTSWRQNPEHIGGFLSDGGVHQLALLTEILGEIGFVSALTKQVRKESGADDVLFSTVSLRDNGVIGTFTYGSAFGATDKSVFLKIYGLNGSIVLDVSNKKVSKVTVKQGGNAEVEMQENVIVIEEDASFGVNAEFENFYEAVKSKNKTLFKGTPRAAFHHLAVVSACLESSKNNGSPINVEQP